MREAEIDDVVASLSWKMWTRRPGAPGRATRIAHSGMGAAGVSCCGSAPIDIRFDHILLPPTTPMRPTPSNRTTAPPVWPGPIRCGLPAQYPGRWYYLATSTTSGGREDPRGWWNPTTRLVDI
jgi:hypothetical protein